MTTFIVTQIHRVEASSSEEACDKLVKYDHDIVFRQVQKLHEQRGLVSEVKLLDISMINMETEKPCT